MTISVSQSENPQKVVILDTGCANLNSVKYAVQRLGYAPIITTDTDIVLTSDKLFLPGVGTAKAAMNNLKNRHLIDLIKNCTQPVLGICLGMQLLAKCSEEGQINTLNLIPQHVTKLKSETFPLPHMGWNTVNAEAGHPLFRDIANNSYFYFVHSYAIPLCPVTIAETEYGQRFSAAIQQDNFYGVQFHPERSGQNGMQLLKNFLEM